MLKFHIETYGCQMNVSDSELVNSMLKSKAFEESKTMDEADIIIFNTCSVREHAEERVLGRISNELSRKQANPFIRVGVIGCMAQRLGEKLLELGVDFVVGVDNYRKLPEIISSSYEGKKTVQKSFNFEEVYSDVSPTRKSDLNAFITIMRGCNNFCSYCIVPHVRGRERSRPLSEILSEVTTAGDEGYQDVTLLGQNVNSYNYEGKDFPDLLREINKIESIKRIRFITSHPKDLSDKLIETMAGCDKVCEHIHLPMQSGDNTILTRMNRGYTIESYKEIVRKLRVAMPDIAITTDIIAGFCGETEEQYDNTYQAMIDIGFDFAYMFKYSVRSGTEAAGFADSVPEKTKLERLDKIINLQGEITLNKYRSQVGRTVEVYVEKLSKKDRKELAGKTRDFKIVVFPADKDLIGSFVRVEIIDAVGWTLKGKLVQ